MFYLIVFLAIIIPLTAKDKRKGLIWSMLILFIPWGLQYEMTNDWNGYIARWQIINEQGGTASFGGREIEPLYIWITQLAKPIGFFGYLIICAVLELSVFYFFIRKYVTPKYYWVVLFCMMMWAGYGLMYINTNRQMLTIILTMMAAWVLFENKNSFIFNKRWLKLINVVVAIALIYASVQIHRGSVIAYLLIPLYFLSNFNTNTKVLFSVCTFLYLGRFFLDLSGIQQLAFAQMDTEEFKGYEHYINEFAEGSAAFSIVEQFCYLYIMYSCIYFYNTLDRVHKFFAICMIIGFLGSGYFIQTLGRTLIYFNVYTLFIVPKIIELWWKRGRVINPTIQLGVNSILFAYSVYSFFRETTTTVYWMRWLDFKTILSAPNWM